MPLGLSGLIVIRFQIVHLKPPYNGFGVQLRDLDVHSHMAAPAAICMTPTLVRVSCNPGLDRRPSRDPETPWLLVDVLGRESSSMPDGQNRDLVLADTVGNPV